MGLISICFFGYSKKYRFLRTQGQIITPTILLKPVGGSLPFFIEMVFGGEVCSSGEKNRKEADSHGSNLSRMERYVLCSGTYMQVGCIPATTTNLQY